MYYICTHIYIYSNKILNFTENRFKLRSARCTTEIQKTPVFWSNNRKNKRSYVTYRLDVYGWIEVNKIRPPILQRLV